MKRNLISTLSLIGMLAVTATQAQAQFSFRFDENGNGAYRLNGTREWIWSQGWQAADPTVAGGKALIYQLPLLVGSGDVAFMEPDNSTTGIYSDALRFYDGKDATGALVSFMNYYSGLGDPNWADTGLPSDLKPTSVLLESGKEGGTQFNYLQAGTNRYIGLSDVPAPAGIITVGINALAICRRRKARKA